MALKMVAEQEVPDEAQVAPNPPPKTVEESSPSSKKSESSTSGTQMRTLEVMTEIRKILSARMIALLALLVSSLLTAAAMYLQTTMSICIVALFDCAVFLPSIFIAYRKG